MRFLTCSFLSLQLLSGMSAVKQMHSDATGINYQAARIAVLALRSTADSTPVPRNYILFPSRVSQTAEEVARVLASREKPMRCRSRKDENTITIACRLLTDSSSLAWMDRASSEAVRMWGSDIKKRCPGPFENVRLLLRWQKDTLVVPVRAFVAWLRDYDIDSVIGSASRRPPAGVCMVLNVGGSATIRIKRAPPSPSRS